MRNSRRVSEICAEMRSRQQTRSDRPLERALRKAAQLEELVRKLRARCETAERRARGAEKLLGFGVKPAVLRGWAGSVVEAVMMSDGPIEAVIPQGKDRKMAITNLHFVARSRGARVSVSVEGNRVAIECLKKCREGR